MFANGCSPGDYITDTPAEASPNDGCNPWEMRDTCPDDPGLDPIHNFMDYSYNQCMFTWTQGQINVMHANIEVYRLQSTPDLFPVALTSGVLSDGYAMAQGFVRQFYLDVPDNSLVSCMATANNGNINLHMSWNDYMDNFECSSENTFSEESCTISSSGRAYAWIYSTTTTIDYRIRCRTFIDNMPPIDLTDGVPFSTSISGESIFHATLPCPNSYSKVICSTTGTGDVSMTVGFSVDFPQCSSNVAGSSNENCTVAFGNGVAYISLLAWEPSDITLTCRVESPIELTSGVTAGPYSVGPYEDTIFYLNVTKPATVECQVTGEEGDFDLYMGWNDPLWPTCYSQFGTTVESCSLETNMGTAYALVHGFTAVCNYNIYCTVDLPSMVPLSNGIPSDSFDMSPGENRLFYLDTSEMSAVTCLTQGSDGDNDLFLGWNDPSNVDCMSTSFDSTEICFLKSNIGRAYIRVYAYAPSYDVTVLCTTSTSAVLLLVPDTPTGPYDIQPAQTLSFSMPVPSLGGITVIRYNKTVGRLDCTWTGMTPSTWDMSRLNVTQWVPPRI